MKSSENPSCRNTTSDNFNEFIYYGLFCLFFILFITLISIVFLSFVAENIYKSCSVIALDRNSEKRKTQIPRESEKKPDRLPFQKTQPSYRSTMIKKDIIQRVAEETGLSKAKSEKAVNAAITLISRELKEGNDVRIPGFGKFSVIEIADKRIGHPVTGKPFEIPAHRRAKFTPGKNLKNSLNKRNTAGKERSSTA